MPLVHNLSILFRSKLFVFILLSASFLWLMRYSGMATPFLVGAAILIIVKHFQVQGWRDRDCEIFYLLIFVYSLWILLSFSVNYASLDFLRPTSFITVSQYNPSWGMRLARQFTQIYMFFPLLYLVAMFFFRANDKGYRWLCLLPIVFVPSVIVALYQGLIDYKFYNKIGCPAPGLNSDCSALGILSFLLFPLCILGVIGFRAYWKKSIFVALIVILLWCESIIDSRTSILGIGIFLMVFPFVWMWVKKGLKKSGFFKVLSVYLFSILLLFGMGYKGVYRVFQIRTHLSNFMEGGIRTMLERQDYGRVGYGLPALGLTMLAPISGWGPGGFYRNFDNYQFKHKKKRLQIHNAANHYLQLSSELGLLGAFLNILLHALPLWMVFRVRNQIHDRSERWAVGIVSLTVLIMMLIYMSGPHGMALDVLWVIVVLLAYLFGTALRYGYSFRRFNLKLFLVCFALLTVLFCWGTYETTFGKYGYQATQEADWWPFRGE